MKLYEIIRNYKTAFSTHKPCRQQKEKHIKTNKRQGKQKTENETIAQPIDCLTGGSSHYYSKLNERIGLKNRENET